MHCRVFEMLLPGIVESGTKAAAPMLLLALESGPGIALKGNPAGVVTRPQVITERINVPKCSAATRLRAPERVGGEVVFIVVVSPSLFSCEHLVASRTPVARRNWRMGASVAHRANWGRCLSHNLGGEIGR